MFVTLSEAKGSSKGIPVRIHTVVTVALLVAAPLHAQVAPSAPAASQEPSSPDSLFNRGLTAFFANDLVTALPLLRRASTAVPEDPERLLWLAETARRLEAFEEADSTIRAAMSLLPCSSFAHTVLATLYSPQYSNWSGVSDDTAWIHLRAAVRCDESDGNAWVPLWIEAQRHEDDSLADRALVQLTRTGFLSGPYLTLARWVLAALPENAVLVTAGDLDTYPAAAVQFVEQVRPDVAVVNLSLLNLPWYAARFRAKTSVPLPLTDDSLQIYVDSLKPNAPYLSALIIGFWRQRAAAGSLGRPLAFALTAGEQPASKEIGSMRFSGPYSLVVPYDSVVSMDTSSIRLSLEQIKAREWVGPAVSTQDRSPVRRVSAVPAGLIPAAVAWLYAQQLATDGDSAGGQRWAEWARGFAREAGLPAEMQRELFGEPR
jgi:hypothetical protein